jgi:hypothetical protein
LYLASDSRISWFGGGYWDGARKLFASKTQPHLLGYCGDVLFPTQVLGQLVELIDSGLVFEPRTAPEVCFERLVDVMMASLTSYPNKQRKGFSVLYGVRFGEGLGCELRLFSVEFRPPQTPAKCEIYFPSQSGLLAVLGSGSASFRRSYNRWTSSDVGGTSRSVFSALSDSLREREDPQSGGPPQLVGLYRQRNGRSFGVIFEGTRYFYGTRVSESVPVNEVKWHNELFEICDPETRARMPTAQPQPRPRKLRR